MILIMNEGLGWMCKQRSCTIDYDAQSSFRVRGVKGDQLSIRISEWWLNHATWISSKYERSKVKVHCKGDAIPN